MIISLLRGAGSVVAGLVVAFLVVIAAEFFSAIYHPYPPGADTSDYEVCRAHVARYPTWVLAGCTAIWAAAPFAGAWHATRLGPARHAAYGIIVGAILLALAGFNMAMLPYPLWFPALIVLTFPLTTILGVRLAKGPLKLQE